MLRVTSALSVVTWTSPLLDPFGFFWPPTNGPELMMRGSMTVVGLAAVVPASITLLRNRPFCVGLSLLISIFGGLAFGVFGIGLLFYCVIFTLDPSPYTTITAGEWFLGINDTTMAALPICWALLWRDYRNSVRV